MNILLGKISRILRMLADRSEVFEDNGDFRMQIIKSIWNEK